MNLSPEAALHELRVLLHCAPDSVRNAFFDEDIEPDLRGADVARRTAEWCETMAQSTSDYEARYYREAARLFRAAMPGLPAHAPPEPRAPGQDVDKLYNQSVARADRLYARRRRGR